MWYYDSVKISRDTFLLNLEKHMPFPGVCFSFVQEKGGGGVTPRQEKFCVEYLIDLNATQAAIRAGYSDKTAYSMGQRLLKMLKFKAVLRKCVMITMIKRLCQLKKSSICYQKQAGTNSKKRLSSLKVSVTVSVNQNHQKAFIG